MEAGLWAKYEIKLLPRNGQLVKRVCSLVVADVAAVRR